MVEDFSTQFSPLYLLGTSGTVYSCHHIYFLNFTYVDIYNILHFFANMYFILYAGTYIHTGCGAKIRTNYTFFSKHVLLLQ